jgi:hypothetical protein
MFCDVLRTLFGWSSFFAFFHPNRFLVEVPVTGALMSRQSESDRFPCFALRPPPLPLFFAAAPGRLSTSS